MKTANQNRQESGNAFFLVMVGVVLFSALMFTFSRGMRQGSSSLTDKQAEVEATDIITYAQLVERGVNRVYGKGFSESNISFDNSYFSGNENPSCTSERCKVFSPQGGGASYKHLGDAWSNTTTDWIFTGNTQVLGIAGDCTADSCADLTMMIEDVPLTLCIALNEQLEVTSTGESPPTDAEVDTTPFTGSFNYDADADIGDEDATLNGKRTACLSEDDSGMNYFYHVLLER